MMQSGDNPLSQVQPNEIARSYDSLELADWSDFELLRMAAGIVLQPTSEPSSFTMHAPLELLARFGLLTRVRADDRKLARIQLVAAAALYPSEGPNVETSWHEIPVDISPPELGSQLLRAIKEGDVERSDLFFNALCDQGDELAVLTSIAEQSLKTLTGGAHTHIGLMLLARLRPKADPELLKLARQGVRSMARSPELNLKPTTGPGLMGELETALANVPVISILKVGIARIVQSTEEAGFIDEVLGEGSTIGSDVGHGEDFIRTACRVAALSMLADSAVRAKYGWTHCLTLPHAAWSLTRDLPSPSIRSQALRSALSWVIAFRAAYGNGHLDMARDFEPVKMDIAKALQHSPEVAAAVAWNTPQKERGALIEILATEAAIRNDAHLVKYTWSCLDLAEMDEERASLYFAAAAYLCSIWCIEEPREVILARLTARPGLK